MYDKIIIGRKDKADFPELDYYNVDIKIDTGAYTSSIHCHHIEEIMIDGIKHLRFQLFDPEHSNFENKLYDFRDFKQKHIKNSFGNSEKRYIIQTQIILFNETHPISLSLSDRGNMKFPVLIGRKYLNGKYIVDTKKTNISYKQKKQQQQKS